MSLIYALMFIFATATYLMAMHWVGDSNKVTTRQVYIELIFTAMYLLVLVVYFKMT